MSDYFSIHTSGTPYIRVDLDTRKVSHANQYYSWCECSRPYNLFYTMSQNLCECVQFSRFLVSVRNSDLRGKVLLEKSGSEQFLRALKEIAVNVVLYNLPLDKSQKVKLQRHGKALKN